MKRIFGFILVCISSHAVCQTKEELLKSKDFQQEIISIFNMSTNISSRLSSEQRTAVIQQFESRKNEQMTDAQQFEFIASSFRFKDVNTFKNFYDSLTLVRQKLKNTYGDIAQQPFTDAAAVIIEGRAPSCESRIRFALCSASITGQGALMLAACEGTTVGIGTPVCVAMALAYTANGIAECYDKWCRKTTAEL
jgi:hypothetical protein